MDYECMECSRKFNKKKIPVSGEIHCPKCGSYDIDISAQLEKLFPMGIN